MKSIFTFSCIFLTLFLKTQASLCQSLSTNYNNNFSPTSCTPIPGEWVKCACNNGTWPGNYSTPYEWQQVGSSNKIFGLSGTVANVTIAGSDFPFSHVFGYDTNNPGNHLYTDWESYIVLDAPYTNLLGKGNAAKDENGNAISGEYNDAINNVKNRIKNLNGQYPTIESGVMGLEFESGLIPEAYRSQIGDRTAVFGDLIVDCGHDDGGFHTEIHPPLMLVNSRQYAGNPLNAQQKLPDSVNASTVSFTSIISRPYKITQLYNGSVNAGQGLTFMNASSVELFKAISLAEGFGIFTLFLAPTYHLTMDADIAGKPFNGFQSMSFDVYPETPPPSPDDVLWNQYHFTVRNGVTVSVQRLTDHLSVLVTMDESKYNSANNLLKSHNRDLDKDDFNKMGFGLIYASVFLGAGIIPGVNADLEQGIQSTVYERTNANEDESIYPSNIKPGVVADASDDQPYPIYGWITLGWEKPTLIQGPCIVKPIQLTTNLEKVDFLPDNFIKSQLVTISNPTDDPIPLGKLKVDGQNGNRFLLQNRTVYLLRNGMQQPPEDISGTVIPPHGIAQFRIAISQPVKENLIATLHIPSQGCELKIPIREYYSYIQ